MTHASAEAYYNLTGTAVKILETERVPSPEAVLSAAELPVYSGLRTDKRKNEWLAGRTAVKILLSEICGGKITPAECEVTADGFGRPLCRGELVSISHSGGKAAAAYKKGCGFIGMDIEKIEPRHKAWYGDYFFPEELPLDEDPASATLAWTVKEAVLKALGLGLRASLMTVNTAGGGVKLYGPALERHRELGSPRFRRDSVRIENDFWLTIIAEE